MGREGHDGAHGFGARMILPAGMVIYATNDSAEGVQDARVEIKRRGFTPDDVRLVKKDGQCLIIAKRPLEPKPTF